MARRPVVLGLAVALALGVAVYLRLWTIDYSFSAGDAELLRKEFDLAHREAMDESAEWRRMYDEELERANRCKAELRELKESFSNKAGDSALSNSKLVMLQKEKLVLLKQVEAVKHELEVEKLNCGSRDVKQ
ncbi:uncharacterized protein LOC104426560 [Eucalyptus grandis]|uniref:uncharacterized protein LOC104426560 n=1 Tax=Eucalyptus grandis TaxID=71139 RepID=UPI00192EF11A|nr:uncharacterized protein LOC104426560 [Eucalyptus grandis]